MVPTPFIIFNLSIWIDFCFIHQLARLSLSTFSLTLHLFTGYPAMPIYWALGYHLCRWGYGNSTSTWEVVKSLRNYGIPQVK